MAVLGRDHLPPSLPMRRTRAESPGSSNTPLQVSWILHPPMPPRAPGTTAVGDPNASAGGNSQNVPIPIFGRVSKATKLSGITGSASCHKRKEALIHTEHGQTLEDYTKSKKPPTKDHMLYECIHIKVQNREIYRYGNISGCLRLEEEAGKREGQRR